MPTFLISDKSLYLAVLPQKVFSQISVFLLLSMPLFILAGELMKRGGVTKALIDLSVALTGRVRGGLGHGHVSIMTSLFVARISGSAVADAAALSNSLVPAMRAQGYSAEYAGAITAVPSIIGPIVPPSIILILYGAIMQISVAALVVAGILPGRVLAAALFVGNAVHARREDHPRLEASEVLRLHRTALAALPALCLPLVIVGGIVGGIVPGWMTPTEAAGVAVLAAMLASIFYSRLTPADVWESLSRTALPTGSIFITLCAVTAFRISPRWSGSRRPSPGWCGNWAWVPRATSWR